MARVDRLLRTHGPHRRLRRGPAIGAAAALALLFLFAEISSPSSSSLLAAPASVTLLNVSYDSTRELYDDENAAFAKAWAARTRQKGPIHRAHGGSGKQARSVSDGREADVVTLARSGDIDAIPWRAGLL